MLSIVTSHYVFVTHDTNNMYTQNNFMHEQVKQYHNIQADGREKNQTLYAYTCENVDEPTAI